MDNTTPIPVRGSIKLKHWLRSTDITQADLAYRLNVTQAAISNIITGRSAPGLLMACKIQRCTGGAVVVTDWLDTESAVELEYLAEAREAANVSE
jgi:plasmid maintenance system antidote protein VapI|tara:strand:- start:506 stop:790 length:285 start_codon:yes stop_codon:yes gene_type:complete